MKELIVTCVFSFFAIHSMCQDKEVIPKDDPQARADFELLRMQDPRTKEIPRGIRQRELDFMVTQRKSLRSANVAQVWDNRGPFNVGGRTRALGVDVTDEDVILAGGVSGGVWRTTDQGTSWVKTTSAGDLQSVSCIAQDPRVGSTDIWYYGTGEITGNSARGNGAPYRGDGIFKSTDGGITWAILASTSTDIPELFDQDFDYNYEIVVNPISGNVIVANYGGIYQSTDGGSSFSLILASASDDWSDVAITSTGIIYASVASSGIWESTDDGSSWTKISQEETEFPEDGDNRKEIAIAPSNENILYVIGLDDNHGTGHMLWKYDKSADMDSNGIGTWTDRSDQIPSLDGTTGNFDSQGGYDLLIKVKKDNEDFIVIGGTNLFASTDGFATSGNTSWIGGYSATNDSYRLYTNHHPDQHSFVFLSGTEALSGNDGGVQLTNDITEISSNANNETVDWVWLNNGYLSSQSYAISVGPGDQIMSGFQDNSTWLTTSTSSTFTWTDQWGGDGAYNAFSSDGTTRWMSSQNASIYRVTYPSASSDTFSTYYAFDPEGDYSTSLFITPFYVDPIDDNMFYLGGSTSLYVNSQALSGSSSYGWEKIDLGSTGVVSEIGVSNFNHVLVGTSDGDLYKVSDIENSTDVEDISGINFPDGYVSGVAINNFNSNEILVCFSNYSIPSIFYSNDGGNSWDDVSGNLEENVDGTGSGPSVRTTTIIGNGDKYLVGTSAGLYSAEIMNSGSTVWSQEDPSGIGNVVVEHFASKPDGFVAAGTHGNGIYSTSFTLDNVLDNDLAVIGISEPVSGVLGSEVVKAQIINSGLSDQSSFEISLTVDDLLIVTDEVSSIINSLGTYDHTFSIEGDFSEIGMHQIKVDIILTADENNENDSFETEVENIEPISSLPYIESFEDDGHGWIGSGVWELGIPSGSKISDASDGLRAWVTDLDSNYPDQHTAILESPFFDWTDINDSELRISFDINYSIEEDWDGVVLGYRTNTSDDFTVIFTDLGLNNWYPGNAIVFGHDAWQGSTNGSYVRAVADISSLAGLKSVQFAFIFESDDYTNDEGVGVDNILISISPHDISLDSESILENQSVGVTVGNLSTEDLDGEEHTYNIESDDDGESFSIVEAELQSAEIFDYETKTTYSITITTTDDDGNEFSKIFSVLILNDETDDHLGVNDLEKYGIRVFPNPVRNTLNLDMINNYYGPVGVSVYSIDGKKTVSNYVVHKTTLSLRRLVDLKSLNRGLYIIELSMGDQVLVGKIIKK